jgi:hypothetical protein
MGRFRKDVSISFGSFQFLKQNDHNKSNPFGKFFQLFVFNLAYMQDLGKQKVSKYCAFHMTSKLPNSSSPSKICKTHQTLTISPPYGILQKQIKLEIIERIYDIWHGI